MAVSHEKILQMIIASVPPGTPEINNLDKPLLDYGLDSLDISNVLLSIEEGFDIEIPDEDMDDLTSINAIIHYLNEKLG